MDNEDKILGIDKSDIPELQPKYLDGLTEKQTDEVLRRWRCVRDFEDGNAVGKIIVDNLTVHTFNEFREISKKYFSNSDGACLSGLVQIFNIEKAKQKIMGDNNGR